MQAKSGEALAAEIGEGRARRDLPPSAVFRACCRR
jgi:hypothetical protein